MDAYPGIPKCYDCHVEGCDADRGSIKCRQNLKKNRFKKSETGTDEKKPNRSAQ